MILFSLVLEAAIGKASMPGVCRRFSYINEKQGRIREDNKKTRSTMAEDWAIYV